MRVHSLLLTLQRSQQIGGLDNNSYEAGVLFNEDLLMGSHPVRQRRTGGLFEDLSSLSESPLGRHVEQERLLSIINVALALHT